METGVRCGGPVTTDESTVIVKPFLSVIVMEDFGYDV